MAQSTANELAGLRNIYEQLITDEAAWMREQINRQVMPGAPLPKLSRSQRMRSRIYWATRETREKVALRLAPWLEPY